MDEKTNQEQPLQEPITEQTQEQTGQKQMRLRIDERNLQTSYSNAFRASETAEEIILDLGLNIVRPATQKDAQPEIVFQANQRAILNYYSAKRLALALGQIVRRHEQQFGEIELDVTKRHSGASE